MRQVFLEVFNASIQGGVLIAVVLLLRLVLRKVPRNTICLLWLLVGVRLLMPFEIESSLSLQPRVESVTESQWVELENREQIPEEPERVEVPQASTPVQNPPDVEQTPVPPVTDEKVEVERKINWFAQIPYLWLAVAVGLAVYGLASYLGLKRRVRDGVIFAEGIWVCPKLDTAFVLGFLRPQIYLPAGLTEEEREFVVAHERSHIARLDHWWKLLGFGAVAVHWFNPLVWIAFACLSKDIEMACDEHVIRGMDMEKRKAYSQALVACAAHGCVISACPVAFGEVSVKERVKAVLFYKKPTFWIAFVAVVAVIAVAVCFLTSPVVLAYDYDLTKEQKEMVEQCHQAVQQIVNSDAGYLTRETRHESHYTERIYSKHLYVGECAYHSYHDVSVDYESKRWRVEQDGCCYIRNWYNGQGETTETDWCAQDIAVDSYDVRQNLAMWSSADVCDAVRDGDEILLTFVGEPLDYERQDRYTVDGYTIRFGFDGDELVNITWEYTRVEDDGIYRGETHTVSCFTIHDTPESEILQQIVDTYAAAHAACQNHDEAQGDMNLERAEEERRRLEEELRNMTETTEHHHDDEHHEDPHH